MSVGDPAVVNVCAKAALVLSTRTAIAEKKTEERFKLRCRP